ncbi:Galactokinase (Galactose kinase), partial [Durusdinium trenchii]
VVGKHTDYAAGRSVVCAVDRGLVMVFRKRADGVLRVSSCDVCAGAGKEVVEIALDDPAQALDTDGWAKYVSAVVQFLRSRKVELHGVDIAIKSSLPQNSGLSSSSAIVCGITAILRGLSCANGEVDLNSLSVDDLGLTEAMDLVGTRGGSQDHAAIMKSKQGMLSLFDYSAGTRLVEQIAMPAHLCFAIAVSGVSACKTGNALERYNRLATSSHEEKVARAQAETQNVVSLAWAGFGEDSREKLVKAIAESQRHAETSLQTTVPETEWLPAEALRLGAIGSTTFGAGFGGSVYALVDRDSAADFLDSWRSGYTRAFPAHAEQAQFFVVREPGSGMSHLGSVNLTSALNAQAVDASTS